MGISHRASAFRRVLLVPNAEELVQDPWGNGANEAPESDVSLKEMSLVSNSPTYAGTEVELRNEDFGIHTNNTPSIGTLWL